MGSVLLGFVDALNSAAGEVYKQIYKSACVNAVNVVGAYVVAVRNGSVLILSLCDKKVGVKRLNNVLIGAR